MNKRQKQKFDKKIYKLWRGKEVKITHKPLTIAYIKEIMEKHYITFDNLK